MSVNQSTFCSVQIPVQGAEVQGDLVVPQGATGMVLFAHGSGSSRFSPRNRFVAQQLQQSRLATLLLDLLSEEEELVDQRTHALRFDVGLLAERLKEATMWLAHDERTEDLPLGYFGASTGAAAALIAAADLEFRVQAVVSRGGRPDLAQTALADVQAATLFIVGGNDQAVMELNQQALAHLHAPTKELAVVPGATHLFEEPGTLQQVAKLAVEWFLRHLSDSPRQAALYHDRKEAGQNLVRHLSHYANRQDVIVLGLPRGGVPVAYEVARALHAPLDVFVVRKLGLPGHQELAMGAIASGGVRVLNEELMRMVPISAETIEAVTAEELQELERRERLYRRDRFPLQVRDRRVILVDDGVATGSTVKAAIRALRKLSPATIIVAVPVGSKETCDELHAEADEVICPQTPDPFGAVGSWYANFRPTSDAAVQELLASVSSPVHR